MLTSAIVQTTRQQTDRAVGYEIPPSVLVIGKKHAAEYLAPALFRLSSERRLEIKARGSLSIVTAVDVAELVRRNIRDLAIRSISIGTDEVVIDGVNRRMSTIEIAMSKEEQLHLPTSLPQLPLITDAPVQEPQATSVVVELDPASIVDRIMAKPVVAKKKRATPKAKASARKVQKKRAAKSKTKSSSK